MVSRDEVVGDHRVEVEIPLVRDRVEVLFLTVDHRIVEVVLASRR